MVENVVDRELDQIMGSKKNEMAFTNSRVTRDKDRTGKAGQ